MKRIFTIVAGLTVTAFATSSAQSFVQERNFAPEENAATSISAMRNTKSRILSVQVSPVANGRAMAAKENETPIYLLEEDFSGMKSGSYGAPDIDTPLWYDFSECTYVWQNMKEGYTKLPKWGCENSYSAGGTAYMRATDPAFSFARLNTPMLDCSGNDGVAFVQFDARTKEGHQVDRFIVEFAETNNMAPTWGNTGGGMVEEIVTDEWKTYTFTMEITGPTTIFNIATSTDFSNGASAELYIDNLKVYQIKPAISRPEGLPHTEYKGSSFKANWKPVDKAVSYNLEVFIPDQLGQPQNVFELKDIKETSAEVTGIESGITYYYTVSAVDAEGNVSRKSSPIMVLDIEAPQLTETPINEKGIYTASWNNVPSAEVYNYYAAYKRDVTENGAFTVTSEDLENIKFEGEAPTFDPVADPASIDNGGYPGSYNSYSIGNEFTQAGWTGIQYTPCKGYAAVDAFYNYYNSNEPMGSLQSPELDLNKDSGKFKVQLKLAAEGEDLTGWVDENGNTMEGIYYPKAAIAAFTYDENVHDFVQREVRYQDLTSDWKDYEFEFTCGTDRTIVAFFVTRVPSMMFIDDIRIIQNAKAGDIYNEPFLYMRYYQDGVSIDVEVPSRAKGKEIWHKVSGVRSQGSNGENVGVTEGQFSEYRKVGVAEHTDIQNSIQEKFFVTVDGNTVRVNNPAGENIEIYSIDGQFVAADRSGDANVSITLSDNGAYLVKVGEKTVKIIF